ncbi:hypothetical protein GCM10028827_11120 [Mucilaginibacter myungsuensis]
MALLDTAIPMVLLNADTVELTIITYNNAYTIATHLQDRPVKGIAFWEAFDPAQAGGSGPTLLLEAFHEAIVTQKQVQMPPLQYNILSGKLKIRELSWWDVKIVPVIYAEGVKYLLLQVRNVTDQIVHKDAIEQAIMRELTLAEDLATSNVKLAAANDQLAELNNTLEQRVFERTQKLFESEAKQRKLIDNTPIAIAVLKGPEHVVETANQKIINYWGKTARVIGLPLAEALPELEGQPFIKILDEVRETGIPYVNAELEAFLNFEGQLVPRYYDMIYQPIQHVAGVTDSIFIVAVDITDHVTARKQLEGSKTMLQLAVNAANIGIWSVVEHSGEFSYNDSFATIMGWERDELMTCEQAIQQVAEPCRTHIAAILTGKTGFREEYDLTCNAQRFNDGEVVKLRIMSKVNLSGPEAYRIFSGVLHQLMPPFE